MKTFALCSVTPTHVTQQFASVFRQVQHLPAAPQTPGPYKCPPDPNSGSTAGNCTQYFSILSFCIPFSPHMLSSCQCTRLLLYVCKCSWLWWGQQGRSCSPARNCAFSASVLSVQPGIHCTLVCMTKGTAWA